MVKEIKIGVSAQFFLKLEELKFGPAVSRVCVKRTSSFCARGCSCLAPRLLRRFKPDPLPVEPLGAPGHKTTKNVNSPGADLVTTMEQAQKGCSCLAQCLHKESRLERTVQITDMTLESKVKVI